jgi:hypothetical protein
VAQVDEGTDIQGDHALETLGVLGAELIMGAEAGVVDQTRRPDTPAFELGTKRAAGVWSTEIASDNGHLDLMREGEFPGKRLEAVGAPGNEDEIGAPARQLPGEFRSEAGACSGDDGGLGCVVDFAHTYRICKLVH